MGQTQFSLAKDNAKFIIWNSKQGLKILEESKYKNDFYQLINFFQPQENPLYCGPATATIILNALNYPNITSQKTGEIRKPQSLGSNIIEYKLYSQNDFFNKKANKIKNRKIIELKKPKKIVNNDPIYDPGVTLDEFSKILKKAHNLKVKKTHISKYNQKNLKKFRDLVKEVTLDNNKILVANYNGKKFGGNTNGHISPLVAYNENTDHILVLDVALHKGKWFWIKVEDLFKAMNSLDGKNYRGYLVVFKNN